MKRRKLPVPIPCEYHPSLRLFSASCDSDYIFFVMRNRNGRDTDEDVLYLLDVESLRVAYHGPFRPYIEFERLSEESFSRLWEQLANAKRRESDYVIWQLVAGLDETAERIKSRLGLEEQMPQAELDEQVALLDGPRIAIRDAAFQTLKNNAKSHVDYLRSIPADSLSSEQVARIQALFEFWTPSGVLEQRAKKVLQIIEAQGKLDQ